MVVSGDCIDSEEIFGGEDRSFITKESIGKLEIAP